MAGQDYSGVFGNFDPVGKSMHEAHEASQIQALNIQNQANQAQLAARMEMGKILQGAIDQKTGQLDYNKAFIGMAANPATAWMAPDFLDKAVSRQLTQKEVALKELEYNTKQQTAIYDATAGLLPLGTSMKQKDVLKAAQELYGAGIIDKEHLMNFAQSMPSDGPALYKYAQQVALRAQGAKDTLGKVYQDIQAKDYGGGTAFVQPQPMEGRVKNIADMPHTLSPADRLQTMEVIDSDGSVTGQPGAKYPAFKADLASGGVSAPTSAGKGAGGSVVPPAPNSDNPPFVPPKVPVTQISPQMAKAWEQMEGEYKTISEVARANVEIEKTLNKAEELLKVYKPSAGADVRESVAKGLQALGVNKVLTDKDGKPILNDRGEKVEIIDGIANGSLSAGQVFKSVMLDLAANRVRKAIGAGKITNVEFQSFVDTKPNPNMSEKAVRELIHLYRKGILLDKAYMKGYNFFLDPKNKKTPFEFREWWAGIQQDLLEDKK